MCLERKKYSNVIENNASEEWHTEAQLEINWDNENIRSPTTHMGFRSV